MGVAAMSGRRLPPLLLLLRLLRLRWRRLLGGGGESYGHDRSATHEELEALAWLALLKNEAADRVGPLRGGMGEAAQPRVRASP